MQWNEFKFGKLQYFERSEDIEYQSIPVVSGIIFVDFQTDPKLLKWEEMYVIF